jgi:NAD(P)H-dependent FMN reductase
MNKTYRLAVIIGSTRQGRTGEAVALWAASQIGKHGGFTVDWIDLKDLDLGTTQSADHPKSGRYSPSVAEFAQRIDVADAFLIVAPEYNHGYPAALKHALDAVYAEWNAKPAAIVSYGGSSGGIRAAEQLRQVLAELHVVTIRDALAFPFAGRAFAEDGTLRTPGREDAAAKRMLDQLLWWTEALADARLKKPFTG